MQNKSQAALDFLITYGWALVVVGLAMGAIFYSGLLTTKVYQGETCRGFSQIYYVDHTATEYSFSIKLGNATRGDIAAGDATLYLDADNDGTYDVNVSNTSTWKMQSVYTFQLNVPANKPIRNIVSLKLKFKPREYFEKTELANCGTAAKLEMPETITIEITQGESYQDEGTLSCDDTSLLKYLDTSFAPDPCGTATHLYYATGSSAAYFDAVAIRFDVASYMPSVYDAYVRFYVRDGGYSTAWHHYKIYDSYMDNSECTDAGPTLCPGVKSFADGYEGWIEELLPDDYWDDGDLSIRIWDAAVDRIEIKLVKT